MTHAAPSLAVFAGAPMMPAPGAEITVAGVTLVADLAGTLYWPDEGALIVSDLHLEKGSAFAVRGVLMPPYDTAATLEALGAVIARYAARMVIALGDNFHDGGGPARLAATDRAQLHELQRGRDWVWIAGNHDPDAGGSRRRVRSRARARRAVVPPRADRRIRRDRRSSASAGHREFEFHTPREFPTRSAWCLFPGPIRSCSTILIPRSRTDCDTSIPGQAR